VTAVLRRVEPDAGNALFDDVIIPAATKPIPDALAALRHLPKQVKAAALVTARRMPRTPTGGPALKIVVRSSRILG
jgi:hypothetical protein